MTYSTLGRAALVFVASVVVSCLIALPAQGQEAESGESIRVFLDCSRCDDSYVRREITMVDYVRNRQQADVHVLATSSSTGSGGRRYRLQFIGREAFEGTEFELTHTTSDSDTRDEERQELVETLKVGLAPFIHETDRRAGLDLSYERAGAEVSGEGRSPASDPWNSWVFEVSLSGGLELEQRQDEYDFDVEVEADRITPTWRIQNELQIDYERDDFMQDSVQISSISRRTDMETMAVRSINDHWSLGAFGDAYSNTFSNTQLGLQFTPAVEYNYFPYEMSDQKELTVAYRIGPRRLDYREETIYGHTEQIVMEHSLDVTLRMNQTWGYIFASLEGGHYFHDFQKNRLEFDSRASLQLVEGLSLQLGLDADLIHDQLHIPKGDAPLEDVLLRRRDLLTDYAFEANIGLAYTFGSIYNNVVNTRL